MNYKHSDITQEIIAAVMEVHRELKNGFQERVYQRSLAIEMSNRKLAFLEEVEISIYYKGAQVGLRRVDFLVADTINVEIKAVSMLENVHLAQALNYLEASNLEVGLLLNFGAKSLEIKRLYNKKYNPAIAKL
jgi:GxxExxY protein